MSFIKTTGKLDSFFKTSQQYVYKKGSVILRAGDIPSGIYYIESGFVKVYSLNLDGSENIHIILKPGEVFPRRWSLEHTVENTSFEAITPVVLRRKPEEAFLDLINTDADALRDVFKLAMDFINVLINRVENLELTNSYPRIINRLLLLSRRFGDWNGDQVTIAAPITHGILANSINMSRETASRELENIKRKGIITEKRHFIIINDIKKLEKEFTDYFEKK